mgnify:CR=1 FL=1
MVNLPQAIGIDVSKATLDVYDPVLGSFRTTNDEAGLQSLVLRLSRGYPVCLECSGGYERLARHGLSAAGFEVRALNPRKVSRLADARVHHAKTDVLDARLLSEVGLLVVPCSTVSPDREALLDRSRHIARLSVRMGAVKAQRRKPGQPAEVLASLDRELAYLEQEHKSFRDSVQRDLRTSRYWARYQLVLSICGFGPDAARILALELPECLDDYSSKQICAYAGLAPMARSSGTKDGPRHILPGQVHLKRILYMVFLCQLTHRPDRRQFYDRLRAAGKSHQCAAVAVMHKALKEALSVLRRGTRWTKENHAVT